MITGASNVSTAMGYGKLAARQIDLQFMETNRWSQIFPKPEYEEIPPEEPSQSRRHTGRELGAAVRVKSDTEVATGLTKEEAMDEACRCLRCDVEVANVS